MSRLGKHKELKNDVYSRGSKKKLKGAIEHKMKRIYVEILDCVEKEKFSGNIERDVFDRLRSKILSIGNDQIRNMRRDLDERYNIEFVVYENKFPVKPIQGYPEAIVGGKINYEG